MNMHALSKRANGNIHFFLKIVNIGELFIHYDIVISLATEKPIRNPQDCRSGTQAQVRPPMVSNRINSPRPVFSACLPQRV